MLQYDIRGNLFPSKVIDLKWEDLETNLVIPFPNSEKRKGLFANFTSFVERLKKEIAPTFIIWVDGSFVSKKLNPGDVDAVFFIDHKYSRPKKSVLDNFWFTKSNKYSKGLDLYYSIHYSENHKLNYLTHLDRLYWKDVYGNTRMDSNGNSYKKGFIEIKIS